MVVQWLLKGMELLKMSHLKVIMQNPIGAILLGGNSEL